MAKEAFDICCLPPKEIPKVTWTEEQLQSHLLIISKEFAPKRSKYKYKTYGNGSCVPYARYETGIQLTGWAGTLLSRAGEAGYATSTQPALRGMVITNESNGHVAVVEEITDKDTIVISEQNYKGPHIVSTREIHVDSPKILGYIHASSKP